MFFLNEPLIHLVCKDPWRLKSLRPLLSEKADVQRTVQKQPFPLLLLPPFRTRSQEAESWGLSDLWEMPCRGANVQIRLICAQKERRVHFKNPRRIHLPVSVQIPLIAHMLVSSQYYLPTNSSPKYTQKKQNFGFFDNGY